MVQPTRSTSELSALQLSGSVSQLGFRLLGCLFLAASTVVAADSAVVQGGLSPDARYEVRIDRVEPTYAYSLIDHPTGKLVGNLGVGGGYRDFDGARQNSVALWNSTSSLFALVDPGTKRSIEVYVFRVANGVVTLVELPHYQDNCQGRWGQLSGFDDTVGNLRWQGHKQEGAFHQEALRFRYSFQVETPERHELVCHTVLVFHWGPSGATAEASAIEPAK